MNTTSLGGFERGDTVCRPSGWRDVAQFFLLNYGLHAVTVLTEPGSKPLASILTSFTAILMPSAGILRAFDEICLFAIWGATDLDVALRAGALCMLVPTFPPDSKRNTDKMTENAVPIHTEHSRPKSKQHLISPDLEKSPSTTEDTPTPVDPQKSPSKIETDQISPDLPSSSPTCTVDRSKTFKSASLVPVFTSLTEVHGEYPTDLKELAVGIKDLENGARGAPSHRDYSLVVVPRTFTVCGNIDQPSDKQVSKAKNYYGVIKDWFKKQFSQSKKSENTPSGQGSASLEKPGAGDSVAQEVQHAPKPARVADASLASNFNFVKTIAAIIQIIYGSFELYQISRPQLSRYGYTSYQLTVIPYVLMSLANLIAGLTGPRYPSRYLVHYHGLHAPGKQEDPKGEQQTPSGGSQEVYPQGWWNENERLLVEQQTSGAVGRVYGHFPEPQWIDQVVVGGGFLRWYFDTPKRVFGELKQVLNSTKQDHDSTEQVHDSTNQDHDLIKQVHDSTKQDNDSIKQVHDSTKQDHDSIKQVHDSTKQDHDSTKQVHGSTKQDHDSTKQVHGSTKQDYLSPQQARILHEMKRVGYLRCEIFNAEDANSTTGTSSRDYYILTTIPLYSLFNSTLRNYLYSHQI
jgi:hypothetical protein